MHTLCLVWCLNKISSPFFLKKKKKEQLQQPSPLQYLTFLDPKSSMLVVLMHKPVWPTNQNYMPSYYCPYFNCIKKSLHIGLQIACKISSKTLKLTSVLFLSFSLIQTSSTILLGKDISTPQCQLNNIQKNKK